MSSLKQLKSIVLKFAMGSKCGGFAIAQRLMSPKMVATNPDCAFKYQVLQEGQPASIALKYQDDKEELLDISGMNGPQVFEYIESRIQERTTQDVLKKHKFVGEKLTSAWGM